jgi:hypothetical protein
MELVDLDEVIAAMDETVARRRDAHTYHGHGGRVYLTPDEMERLEVDLAAEQALFRSYDS